MATWNIAVRGQEIVGSLVAAAAILVAQTVFIPSLSWPETLQPKVSVSGNQVSVITPSGMNQMIVMGHDLRPTDIKFEDLTFSGRMDLKILDTLGASQIFYKVYLFSPVDGIYIFNNEMSEIPCLGADEKRRQLVGACYHASACENWEERYAVSPEGALFLVERTGTYCEPNGKSYRYTDNFRNGERVSSKVKIIDR
ncbi:XAC2610-related protein [Cupriavidus necator]|uniref:XAC2610-related protein n=1 Tax=Cupriavidus necator TaxID=106590 RepID=UPI00140FBD40|nr:hypothetical protein [Cupriavidus necator]